MLHALALGADWVWLGDDDGRAADETVLATLLDVAQRRMLAAVSPVVVDADDPDRLAFTVRRGLTWHTSRSTLAAEAQGELLSGIAALFNGALFRAAALDMIGVPDLRLFVRGDEVEMHRRMVRSRLPFGTSLSAAYLHPRGTDDLKPMLGGRLHAQHPDDAAKRYYTYRNRGYLVSSRGCGASGCWSCPGSPGTSSSPDATRRGSPSGCGCCGRAGRSGSTGCDYWVRLLGLTTGTRGGRRSRGSRRARTARGPARGRRRSW